MNLIRGVAQFLARFGEDALFLLGLFVLCRATFLWSAVAGWYAVGLALVLVALLVGFNAKQPPQQRR